MANHLLLTLCGDSTELDPQWHPLVAPIAPGVLMDGDDWDEDDDDYLDDDDGDDDDFFPDDDEDEFDDDDEEEDDDEEDFEDE